MSLRLVVDSPEPPPLPAGEALVASARRPGELHDVVALGRSCELVAAKAARSRIGVDLAATLLLELHLLACDCVDAGSPLPAAPPISAPRRRLSAAEADYLRVLTFRPGADPASADRVALPVRLLPHVTPSAIETASGVDLEDAIRWEVVALLEGRTIGEHGLLLALRGGA
jgi:hypothetical protein